MDDSYEVVLGPAAKQVVLSLRDEQDVKDLAEALRTELINGPNAEAEYEFSVEEHKSYHGAAAHDPVVYTATPLSFDGYVAIHRPMTLEEFRRKEIRRLLGHSASCGRYVLDILPAGWGFTCKPRATFPAMSSPGERLPVAPRP